MCSCNPTSVYIHTHTNPHIHIGKLWDLKFLLTNHNKQIKQARRSSILLSTMSNGSGTGSGSGLGSNTNTNIQSHPIPLAYVLPHIPPVYIYSCVFWDIGASGGNNTNNINTNINNNAIKKKKSTMPSRSITGAADGQLRVWEGGECIGSLTIGNGNNTHNTGHTGPVSQTGQGTVSAGSIPHSGGVTSLCIEETTKYLISGDADGLVLIWKVEYSTNTTTNDSGSNVNIWYRILRKLRTGMLKLWILICIYYVYGVCI